MLGKEEVDRSGAVQQEWWVNGMQDALWEVSDYVGILGKTQNMSLHATALKLILLIGYLIFI
jgi:hypothetical protein